MKQAILALLLTYSTLVTAKELKILLQIHFVDELEEIPINKNSHPKYTGMYKIIRGVCHVWLKRPEDFFDYGNIGVLGHELMHCYEGPHSKEYIDKVYNK